MYCTSHCMKVKKRSLVVGRGGSDSLAQGHVSEDPLRLDFDAGECGRFPLCESKDVGGKTTNIKIILEGKCHVVVIE